MSTRRDPRDTSLNSQMNVGDPAESLLDQALIFGMLAGSVGRRRPRDAHIPEPAEGRRMQTHEL